MRCPHIRSAWGAAHSISFMGGWCAVLAVLLSSCTADLPLQRDSRQAVEAVREPSYSIVCVIHGDGDYVYHDTSGNEHNADEDALAEVKRVAEQNPDAEVLVFHQKPANYVLLFFPVRDGEFYYYRNGQLIAHEAYWRDQERSQLEPEAELYRRYSAASGTDMVKMFIYCGHEIPEVGGTGYDASYPERTFTVPDLAHGLEGFTAHSTKFDLLVLATCYGGTPYTIGALGPFARTIIASPDNLHLSYFDLQPLAQLGPAMRHEDVPAFAKQFARRSFDRLTAGLETAVSVAVYDVDSVQDYVHSVQKTYVQRLAALNGETLASLAMIGRRDCAEIPAYARPTMSQGVEVFYRPAHFGRSRNKQSHSGWECWGGDGSQMSSSGILEKVLK